MNLSPLWLITNAASGSNSDAAVDTLAASLGAAGCAPARIIRCPDDELPERADLEAAGVATLAVFTGDGTANSAASRLEGWGGAILIFPGGTQNLLSKALHGDIPAEAIIKAVAAGSHRRVRRRVVRTSAGPALVEVLVGPGALWADVREGLRDFDLGTIADSLGNAMRETREGPGVVLADPQAGKPDGYRAIRFVPGPGPMEAYGYDFTDLADFAAQGFAMLIKRDFRQGPHDHLGAFDKATCRSAAPIAVMIDGERSEGGTEEHFACEEFAVDFIAVNAAGD